MKSLPSRPRRLIHAMWILAMCGGCAAWPSGKSTAGGRFPDPDAAFLKKVEKDPFPRAVTVGGMKR